MQTKSAYHGKTINLTSDNTVITSTNFSVDKNGNITAKGGTIGGFTLGATQFSSTINGVYDYNVYDVRFGTATIIYDIQLPTILKTLYDLTGDGAISVRDLQEMIKINLGTATNTKKISGTFQINSSNPKNFISIKNENNLAVSIGVGGVNSHFVGAETIVCSSQSVSSNNFKGVVIDGSKETIYCVGTDNGLISTSISAKKIVTPEIQVDNEGTVMYGMSEGHKYRCNWTNTQLQFWVDETNVGTLSDKRLKTDIKEIDNDFIQAIKEIEMKQFKIANRNGLVSFGILAQDLIEIFKKYNKNPFDYEIIQEAKYKTDDDTIYYTINYEQFLILKTKAQEIQIAELEEKINKICEKVEV